MTRLVKGFQTLTLPLEWLLIKRAKLGEKEAFGKLYEMYVDRIYRFVFFRVRQQKALAEDLTSDVFLRAWEHLDTFHKGSFQAWLYMIARNKVIDYFRITRQHTELDEHIVDEKENVEEKVMKKVSTEEVIDKLDILTDEQKEIILLRFVDDMSYKEIATLLGKREDAIRAMQYRAIKQLKENV